MVSGGRRQAFVQVMAWSAITVRIDQLLVTYGGQQLSVLVGVQQVYGREQEHSVRQVYSREGTQETRSP